MKKTTLVITASFAGILLFLLASASANTSFFARYYYGLLGLNSLVVLALFALLTWQMRGLWYEYRARIFGSRLKLRLILMFGFMAISPGILIYTVSVQFLTKSIESWFNIRVEKALESGLDLSYEALALMREELDKKARDMALELSEQTEAQWNTELAHLREQMNVQSAGIFSTNGQLIAMAVSELSALRPPPPSSEHINRLRMSGRILSEIENTASEKMALRALVPIQSSGLGQEMRVLQLLQSVPERFAINAEQIQGVYKEYHELRLGRDGLAQIYTVTLTLALLLALFSAIVVAFLLARRLSEPLSVLAEGTQAIASGDFTPRQTIDSRDELGMLTQSFGRMTFLLDEARKESERHRIELESARAYLELILGNLSAGVLVFGRDFFLRIANRGAKTILGDEFDGLLNASIEAWPHAQFLGEAIRQGFAEHGSREWQAQVKRDRPGMLPQVLLMRGTTLSGEETGGRVVVFDDITQLILAQRSIAWGEVARRLAHEIKNPLTPIQLSAERLQVKLQGKLHDEGDREALGRSTRTIVNQVQALKRMVDEFSEYARLPAPELKEVDFNALIVEVLGLYEASKVVIHRDLEKELPKVLGDASQLRQIIHNLLRNAEDALEESSSGELRVVTRRAADKAELSIIDSGAGFPLEIMSRVFEPYVTTKAGGTGLGLSIVKKIVDEHRGQIMIKNREPQGAEVCICLPLACATLQTMFETPEKG